MKIKLPILALAALLFAGLPVASSSAYVGVSVSVAPPLIPVYTQPYCPGPGYIWTPGYWDYSDFGYYWVPGVWVLPPRIGFLWTPGYWGYRSNRYIFNNGYWGPSVGYYGGINYGFGYVGSGYYGGQWVGSTFRYNTAVNRVNRNVITNTYVDNSFASAATQTRASFNGPGGVKAQPTAQEQNASKSQRIAPTKEQRSVVEAAKKDPALHAANNKGKPKAEAVNAVRSKANPAAAENGKRGQQGQAEKQGRAATQARAEKTSQRAERNSAQQTERSRPAAKANRTLKSARPAAQSGPSLNRNKATQNRPRAAVQQTQRGPQRGQAVMNRRPAQGPARKGPAQEEQKKGKKKKRPDDR